MYKKYAENYFLFQQKTIYLKLNAEFILQTQKPFQCQLCKTQKLVVASVWTVDQDRKLVFLKLLHYALDN